MSLDVTCCLRLSTIHYVTREHKIRRTLRKITLMDIVHYFSFQEELSVQDRIIFGGERDVIPDTLWSEITCHIHSTHLGMEECLQLGRECVYWQGMNKHIKIFRAKCDICRSVDTKQQKETFCPHEVPSRLWTKVTTTKATSLHSTTIPTFGKSTTYQIQDQVMW